ncbi:S-DNA-T family DNA segregation ATPase FtsK/SpoIIIE [Alkalibacillus filiformis]|uniref:S-DNA-T family DNA segregation ATPase FtsK/SpoIIIE n=1 Tax=Alkalibacillus filiformis TaxID=200990 RepID=A0ABU0DQS9_9BACI|nr:DNA translocase FtsK [Alkalibacillus filiformis]MDQ0350681.1 S-DNA-T family DNA segregation ATPase FtsK/SpoIIIE [Alkalibacillus filiformis]
MAKKKRKTKRNKRKPLLKFELIGLLLILTAIFSSGITPISEGVIPNLLTNLLQWLFGFWYAIASGFMFVLGLYLLVKRTWPTFTSMKWIGFYVLVGSIILYTHVQAFETVVATNSDQSIFTLTWDFFDAYQNGIVTYEEIGAGMTGALLFFLSFYLLSSAGAKVLALFALIIGIMLLSEKSLTDVINQVYTYFKTKFDHWKAQREKSKEEKQKEPKEKPEPDTVTVEIEDHATPQEEPVIEGFETYGNEPDLTEIETKEWTETVENESEQQFDEHEQLPLTEVENEDYKLPSLNLLANPVTHSQQQEKSQIQSTVKKLEQTFHSFGVKAKVTKVHVGPAVTKYEVYPDVGVKVSKIVNLHDDLALALAARDIRIEAPIPGKSAIGIEVPNTEVAQVSMREVMQPIHQSPSKLLFGLGRDIAGDAITAELNKMPHMLIAGATGSGKSVCVNGIITSILLRAKPHEVKMMMIDPKKVELNVYNGIPHLLAPVVTDPKKASQALKKIVSEMERRYELFSDTGTRNIEGYNDYINKVNEQEGENHPQLPYIVVLIDELADLMMVASNEVEDAITRLAQMARAAGIHLIIATQRPSVDVITGVIKANIPSRIAFSVSSQTDSRTILDSGGAEKLLGKGDMLFLPVGASKPTRIQGAFLSDEEVESVVDFCIEQQKAQYQEEMIPSESNEQHEEVDDELYEDAVQLIVEMQSASVSMLQRKFRIGYTRAARLIDAMEERGIVGPYEGSKPRKVLGSPNTQHEEQSS